MSGKKKQLGLFILTELLLLACISATKKHQSALGFSPGDEWRIRVGGARLMNEHERALLIADKIADLIFCNLKRNILTGLLL